MGQDFKYDVFLSHSAKDKAVVRPLAERLRQNVLRSVSQAFGGSNRAQLEMTCGSLPKARLCTASYDYSN